MITIKQLLESVDLDFEPRFVTKDENGAIYIWADKPETENNIWDAPLNIHGTGFGPIKLTEFHNKKWQKCIYEVLRKTTRKIEKINKEKFNFVYSRKEKNDIESALIQILDKQAELVDTINEHADIIRQIGQWGSSKGECLWCEKITKFEPGALKRETNDK